MSRPPKVAASSQRNLRARFSLGLTAVLLIGGLWYLSRTIDFADVQRAIASANGWYILLALAVFVLNGSLKAWRWRVLLVPDREKNVPFAAVFWAIWLGQFVNNVVPFLRLGEISRAYAIHQQTGLGKVRSLSTIVVEKSLELIMLGLLLLVLLPIFALPDAWQSSSQSLLLIAAVSLIGLTFIAYKTSFVIAQLRRLFGLLPRGLEERLDRLLISGLEGLASLRSGTAVLRLLGSSVLLMILSLLTPFLLFQAFSLPLGIAEAAVVDSALSLTTSAPSTPAQLGIYEGTVVVVLSQFGQIDQAVAFSFAVVYHLLVLLPKFVLGGLAAQRTNWRWQQR